MSQQENSEQRYQNPTQGSQEGAIPNTQPQPGAYTAPYQFTAGPFGPAPVQSFDPSGSQNQWYPQPGYGYGMPYPMFPPPGAFQVPHPAHTQQAGPSSQPMEIE